MLDCCNQRGVPVIVCAGGCWTAAIKGGVCDIVCTAAAIKWGVRDIICAGVDPCNQRGRARYRLRGGVLNSCNQGGGCAISSGVLDLCNQRGGARRKGVCDIVCAGGQGAGPLHSKGGCAISSGGCWSLAIKGGVHDVVCAEGCWTAAIKGGVRNIVCAGGCCTAAQSKRGARFRLGGWLLDCCNSMGASARGGVLDPGNHRGARYRLRRGLLDPCNQRTVARYRLQGGWWTAAIKGWVRDIVCAGTAEMPQFKEGARYRLRGGAADYCNKIKGVGGRYCLLRGLLECCDHREDACAISSAGCCNST